MSECGFNIAVLDLINQKVIAHNLKLEKLEFTHNICITLNTLPKFCYTIEKCSELGLINSGRHIKGAKTIEDIDYDIIYLDNLRSYKIFENYYDYKSQLIASGKNYTVILWTLDDIHSQMKCLKRVLRTILLVLQQCFNLTI